MNRCYKMVELESWNSEVVLKRNTSKMDNINNDNIIRKETKYFDKTGKETTKEKSVEKVTTEKTYSLNAECPKEILSEISAINQKINPVVAFLNRQSLKNAVKREL